LENALVNGVLGKEPVSDKRVSDKRDKLFFRWVDSFYRENTKELNRLSKLHEQNDFSSSTTKRTRQSNDNNIEEKICSCGEKRQMQKSPKKIQIKKSRKENNVEENVEQDVVRLLNLMTQLSNTLRSFSDQ